MRLEDKEALVRSIMKATVVVGLGLCLLINVDFNQWAQRIDASMQRWQAVWSGSSLAQR
jgi:hypothetical protein